MQNLRTALIVASHLHRISLPIAPRRPSRFIGACRVCREGAGLTFSDLDNHRLPPELEHPVDMTKVKMDVIRPWIATRATELLGFEDEVLINFVYGLLDGKEVDGKQIQIQLTGFLEKNTGKFMKELWGLLLSAQLDNASGVPQQFLDTKQEEMRKRKG